MTTAPIIILIKPQLAENIGMVARAMKNCNLKELRIVAPEQSPTDEKALRASSKSEEILNKSEKKIIDSVIFTVFIKPLISSFS